MYIYIIYISYTHIYIYIIYTYIYISYLHTPDTENPQRLRFVVSTSKR